MFFHGFQSSLDLMSVGFNPTLSSHQGQGWSGSGARNRFRCYLKLKRNEGLFGILLWWLLGSVWVQFVSTCRMGPIAALLRFWSWSFRVNPNNLAIEEQAAWLPLDIATDRLYLKKQVAFESAWIYCTQHISCVTDVHLSSTARTCSSCNLSLKLQPVHSTFL